MKRIGITISLLAAVLCFAQNTDTLTVTIPADVVSAFSKAVAKEHASETARTSHRGRVLTEEDLPSTAESALRAAAATVIADKVARYSADSLPTKLPGETDTDQRNRYQALLKAAITVK